MKSKSLISVLLFVSLPALSAFGQTAVVVVRHAERADDSTDSPLSAKGEQRAKALAAMLHDVGISAIYVTQFRRTAQTAEPLARNLNVRPVVIRSDDIANVALTIRTKNPNQFVLVVGHSDTVPGILKAFGYLEPITINPDEFDNLFIIVPRRERSPALLRLRY